MPEQDTTKDSRGKLTSALEELARKRGEIVETRVITFTNDDVPKYLADLDAFEEASRRVDLEVVYHITPPGHRGRFLYLH